MYINVFNSGFYRKDNVAETADIASSVKGKYKADSGWPDLCPV